MSSLVSFFTRQSTIPENSVFREDAYNNGFRHIPLGNSDGGIFRNIQETEAKLKHALDNNLLDQHGASYSSLIYPTSSLHKEVFLTVEKFVKSNITEKGIDLDNKDHQHFLAIGLKIFGNSNDELTNEYDRAVAFDLQVIQTDDHNDDPARRMYQKGADAASLANCFIKYRVVRRFTGMLIGWARPKSKLIGPEELKKIWPDGVPRDAIAEILSTDPDNRAPSLLSNEGYNYLFGQFVIDTATREKIPGVCAALESGQLSPENKEKAQEILAVEGDRLAQDVKAGDVLDQHAETMVTELSPPKKEEPSPSKREKYSKYVENGARAVQITADLICQWQQLSSQTHRDERKMHEIRHTFERHKKQLGLSVELGEFRNHSFAGITETLSTMIGPEAARRNFSQSREALSQLREEMIFVRSRIEVYQGLHDDLGVQQGTLDEWDKRVRKFYKKHSKDYSKLSSRLGKFGSGVSALGSCLALVPEPTTKAVGAGLCAAGSLIQIGANASGHKSGGFQEWYTDRTASSMETRETLGTLSGHAQKREGFFLQQQQAWENFVVHNGKAMFTHKDYRIELAKVQQQREGTYNELQQEAVSVRDEIAVKDREISALKRDKECKEAFVAGLRRKKNEHHDKANDYTHDTKKWKKKEKKCEKLIQEAEKPLLKAQEKYNAAEAYKKQLEVRQEDITDQLAPAERLKGEADKKAKAAERNAGLWDLLDRKMGRTSGVDSKKTEEQIAREEDLKELYEALDELATRNGANIAATRAILKVSKDLVSRVDSLMGWKRPELLVDFGTEAYELVVRFTRLSNSFEALIEMAKKPEFGGDVNKVINSLSYSKWVATILVPELQLIVGAVSLIQIGVAFCKKANPVKRDDPYLKALSKYFANHGAMMKQRFDWLEAQIDENHSELKTKLQELNSSVQRCCNDMAEQVRATEDRVVGVLAEGRLEDYTSEIQRENQRFVRELKTFVTLVNESYNGNIQKGDFTQDLAAISTFRSQSGEDLMNGVCLKAASPWIGAAANPAFFTGRLAKELGLDAYPVPSFFLFESTVHIFTNLLKATLLRGRFELVSENKPAILQTIDRFLGDGKILDNLFGEGFFRSIEKARESQNALMNAIKRREESSREDKNQIIQLKQRTSVQNAVANLQEPLTSGRFIGSKKFLLSNLVAHDPMNSRPEQLDEIQRPGKTLGFINLYGSRWWDRKKSHVTQTLAVRENIRRRLPGGEFPAGDFGWLRRGLVNFSAVVSADKGRSYLAIPALALSVDVRGTEIDDSKLLHECEISLVRQFQEPLQALANRVTLLSEENGFWTRWNNRTWTDSFLGSVITPPSIYLAQNELTLHVFLDGADQAYKTHTVSMKTFLDQSPTRQLVDIDPEPVKGGFTHLSERPNKSLLDFKISLVVNNTLSCQVEMTDRSLLTLDDVKRISSQPYVREGTTSEEYDEEVKRLINGYFEYLNHVVAGEPLSEGTPFQQWANEEVIVLPHRDLSLVPLAFPKSLFEKLEKKLLRDMFEIESAVAGTLFPSGYSFEQSKTTGAYELRVIYSHIDRKQRNVNEYYHFSIRNVDATTVDSFKTIRFSGGEYNFDDKPNLSECLIQIMYTNTDLDIGVPGAGSRRVNAKLVAPVEVRSTGIFSQLREVAAETIASPQYGEGYFHVRKHLFDKNRELTKSKKFFRWEADYRVLEAMCRLNADVSEETLRCQLRQKLGLLSPNELNSFFLDRQFLEEAGAGEKESFVRFILGAPGTAKTLLDRHTGNLLMLRDMIQSNKKGMSQKRLLELQTSGREFSDYLSQHAPYQ